MWGGANVPCRRWNLLEQDPALPFFIGLFSAFGKGGVMRLPPAKTPAVPVCAGLAGCVWLCRVPLSLFRGQRRKSATGAVRHPRGAVMAVITIDS